MNFGAGIMLYFFNVQIIFLLRSAEYFNVPDNEIGRISSDIIFYSVMIQMAVVIAVGYIFDLCGRRITLCVSILIQGISLFFLPLVSPKVFPGVYLLRILFSVASMGPICSPLINDYVSRGSRGRANALLILGFQIGEFFNNVILLNIIQDMSLGIQFQIASGIVLAIPIAGIFLIKEPNLKNNKLKEQILPKSRSVSPHRVAEDQNNSLQNIKPKKKLLQKFKKITLLILKQCKTNYAIIVCLYGNFLIKSTQMMLNSFLALWSSSFVYSGMLRDQQSAQELVQSFSTFGTFISIVLIFPAGKIADKFRYNRIMPLATITMIFCIVSFSQIQKPNSLMSYLLIVLMQALFCFQNAFTDALLSKNIPKSIRGTMMGVYQFSGSIGQMILSKLGGYFHDNHGAESPFMIVAVFNVILLLMILWFSIRGKFNH
eukprot:403339576